MIVDGLTSLMSGRLVDVGGAWETARDLPLSFGDQAIEAWDRQRVELAWRRTRMEHALVISSISTSHYRVVVAMTIEQQARYAGFGDDIVTFRRLCEDR